MTVELTSSDVRVTLEGTEAESNLTVVRAPVTVEVVNATAGGGGVTDHGELTGLADDDHKQYQRADSVFTTTSPYGITDESLLVTTGAAVTLPDAEDNVGRSVSVGVSVVDCTISAAGTDTIHGAGASIVVASTNGITFVSVNIGGTWGWAITNRIGSMTDLPDWYGLGIADGNAVTLQSGVPTWTTGTRTGYELLSGTGWTADVPVYVPVKNTSGSTIAKGAPVYATGTVGDTSTVEIAPADADDSAKMPAIGLTESELDPNEFGYVVVVGTLRGVDTQGLAINAPLYVSTTAGQLTITKPTGTSELIQNIGRVIRANQNSGEILVLGPGRTNDVPNAIDAGKLTSGTVATARLGSGTADGTTFLRGDQTWASPPEGWTIIADDLLASNTASVSYNVTGYDQLHVIFSGNTIRNGTIDTLLMTVNGDSSSVYSTNAAALTTSWSAAVIPGQLTNADRHQHVDIRLSLTDGYTKAGYVLRTSLQSNFSVGANPTFTGLFSTLTGAVTSIELAGNLGSLAAGSRIRVLGLEA
jgi:hypothetical protein